MKKRYLAWIMAGTMALSGSCTVFAAEAEAEAETQTETTAEENSVKWEDVAPAVEEADWSGDFVTFDEIAIKMFVPDVLHAAELTEEDKEQGYISYFTTEDEAAAVSVMYVDVQGMDLDEYKTYLEGEDDVTDVDAGTINDIPVLTYTMPENDNACISIPTEAGYILEFAFSPMSDEGFASVAQIMMASIQEEAIDDTSAETAEEATAEAE